MGSILQDGASFAVELSLFESCSGCMTTLNRRVTCQCWWRAEGCVSTRGVGSLCLTFTAVGELKLHYDRL